MWEGVREFPAPLPRIGKTAGDSLKVSGRMSGCPLSIPTHVGGCSGVPRVFFYAWEGVREFLKWGETGELAANKDGTLEFA